MVHKIDFEKLREDIRASIADPPPDPRKLPERPATYTCEVSEIAGPLYYFKLADAVPPPYTKQFYVRAIIDIAEDGTLAGVELIDNMPPPPKEKP